MIPNTTFSAIINRFPNGRFFYSVHVAEQYKLLNSEDWVLRCLIIREFRHSERLQRSYYATLLQQPNFLNQFLQRKNLREQHTFYEVITGEIIRLYGSYKWSALSEMADELVILRKKRIEHLLDISLDSCFDSYSRNGDVTLDGVKRAFQEILRKAAEICRLDVNHVMLAENVLLQKVEFAFIFQQVYTISALPFMAADLACQFMQTAYQLHQEHQLDGALLFAVLIGCDHDFLDFSVYSKHRCLPIVGSFSSTTNSYFYNDENQNCVSSFRTLTRLEACCCQVFNPIIDSDSLPLMQKYAIFFSWTIFFSIIQNPICFQKTFVSRDVQELAISVCPCLYNASVTSTGVLDWDHCVHTISGYDGKLRECGMDEIIPCGECNGFSKVIINSSDDRGLHCLNCGSVKWEVSALNLEVAPPLRNEILISTHPAGKIEYGNGPNQFRFDRTAKINTLNAKCGSGKTEALKRFVSDQKIKNGRVLVISCFTGLVEGLAVRLEIDNYKNKKIWERGTPRMLAICLPSLEKYFGGSTRSPESASYDFIAIDECSQTRMSLLAHYMNSKLTGTLNLLSRFFKKAKSVFLLQHNIPESDIRFWASIAGVEPEDTTSVRRIYLMSQPQPSSVELTMSITKSLLKLREVYLESVGEEGKFKSPIAIPCTSVRMATYIAHFLRDLAPNDLYKARVKLLTGPLRNAGGFQIANKHLRAKAAEMKKFLANPGEWGLFADVLIYTSVMQAGTSIDNHFTTFFGFFIKGNIIHEDQLQMQRRQRQNIIPTDENDPLLEAFKKYETDMLKDINWAPLRTIARPNLPTRRPKMFMFVERGSEEGYLKECETLISDIVSSEPPAYPVATIANAFTRNYVDECERPPKRRIEASVLPYEILEYIKNHECHQEVRSILASMNATAPAETDIQSIVEFAFGALRDAGREVWTNLELIAPLRRADLMDLSQDGESQSRKTLAKLMADALENEKEPMLGTRRNKDPSAFHSQMSSVAVESCARRMKTIKHNVKLWIQEEELNHIWMERIPDAGMLQSKKIVKDLFDWSRCQNAASRKNMQLSAYFPPALATDETEVDLSAEANIQEKITPSIMTMWKSQEYTGYLDLVGPSMLTVDTRIHRLMQRYLEYTTMQNYKIFLALHPASKDSLQPAKLEKIVKRGCNFVLFKEYCLAMAAIKNPLLSNAERMAMVKPYMDNAQGPDSDHNRRTVKFCYWFLDFLTNVLHAADSGGIPLLLDEIRGYSEKGIAVYLDTIAARNDDYVTWSKKPHYTESGQVFSSCELELSDLARNMLKEGNRVECVRTLKGDSMEELRGNTIAKIFKLVFNFLGLPVIRCKHAKKGLLFVPLFTIAIQDVYASTCCSHSEQFAMAFNSDVAWITRSTNLSDKIRRSVLISSVNTARAFATHIYLLCKPKKKKNSNTLEVEVRKAEIEELDKIANADSPLTHAYESGTDVCLQAKDIAEVEILATNLGLPIADTWEEEGVDAFISEEKFESRESDVESE